MTTLMQPSSFFLKVSYILGASCSEQMIPLGLAVFFRINALVLLLMLVFLIVHQVTGYRDLKLAMATRKVTVFEHQVHSLLEVLPLTAILLTMILHWPQTLALFGMGAEAADLSLHLKEPPGWDALFPPLATFIALALLPYAEELWRGRRAQDRSRSQEPR